MKEDASPSAVSRRDLLRIAAGVAAAGPLSGLASATAAAAGPVVSAAVPAAATAAPGVFFSAAELTLLDTLTELIIPTDEHSPGARAAGVAAHIDRRLAEYDPAIPDLRETRQRWKSGLQTLDTLSREGSGQPFLEAAPETQVALLETLAARERDPQTDGERFFRELKQWTARGYYSSRIGIHDEMEYKGNTLQTEYAGIDVTTLPGTPPPED